MNTIFNELLRKVLYSRSIIIAYAASFVSLGQLIDCESRFPVIPGCEHKPQKPIATQLTIYGEISTTEERALHQDRENERVAVTRII